jgi:polyisoprenoid-binding protein YceI
MSPKILLAACAAALLVSHIAAATVDANASKVRFIARQSDVAVEGAFARFSADVDFDPARPQAGKVHVAIDLASTDAGSGDANRLIQGKEFFDVARFPGATFDATTIAANGQGGFVARGPFTLKGHTQELVLPFTVRTDGAGTWLEGGAPLSRLAYHVGEGQWTDTSTLDDEVRIEFKLRLAK